MGKNIIIAEKPSVAREYASALGVSGTVHTDGYIENDKWIVTWSVGHLISMSYPEKYDISLKEWREETLPFLPDMYKYEIIPSVKKQFNVVKSLYNRSDIDCIYYAGDSGREGLYIQMLIRQEAGHKSGIKEFVVWIDSPTRDEIIRGVAEAKDLSAYKAMSSSGYMRAIEDYAVGINFSRLLSIRYAAMLNTGSNQKKHKPISVGRVMTCVLGMVVSREREIRNFSVKNFFKVLCVVSSGGSSFSLSWIDSDSSFFHGSPKLYNDNGFVDQSFAQELIERLSGNIQISSIEKKIVKKNAPLLFNLAELQGFCSRIFKYSPSKTLSITQSLYEKKLVTYPRTDARVLSSAVAGEIDKNLKGLSSGEYSGFVEMIKINCWTVKGKYVDDSKITDHYAIIPTGVLPHDLTEDEKRVYDLICRRFLAVFYPPAEIEKVKINAIDGNEHFVGHSKRIVKDGFYGVLGGKDEDDDEYSDNSDVSSLLNEGSIYDAAYSIKEGKTTPPSRFSTGNLILAMENAGSLIEDDELREQINGSGIGTSATRAEVIDKLIKLNYFSVNEKTQIVSPTNFGEMVYEVVDATIPRLLNPTITAEWEKELDDIAKGNLSEDEFKKNLYDFVSESCESVKKLENNDEIFRRIRPYSTGRILSEYKKFDSWDTSLRCPLCGKNIETTSWGFKCSGNISKNEGCQFVIGDICQHRLLTHELKALLSDGKVGPFYDFVSQKGNPFGACLVWNDSLKKIDFELVDIPWKKTEFKCPSCGSAVMEQNGIFKCSKFIDFKSDSGCKFYIGKILGKLISEKQIEKICNHEKTDLIKGFKPKDTNKKAFDAFLLWSDEQNKVGFIMPTNDDMRTDFKCPECGGSIIEYHGGFRCENYKPENDRDGGCSFIAGKILGHTLSKHEIEIITKGGTTDLINGFKSKDKEKKPFSAKLRYSKEKKGIELVFEEDVPVFIGISCPKCGGKVMKNRFGYFCENNKGRDQGCSFSFSSFLGVSLDENDFKKLISSGRSDLIKGFKPKDKNKKPFDAFLVFDKNECRFSLDFPERKENKSEYSCPCCHKKLIKTDYSLKCDCGFNLSLDICEKRIPEDQLKLLFVRGVSDVISGFWSAKRRGYFSAKLKIKDKGVEFIFPERKE